MYYVSLANILGLFLCARILYRFHSSGPSAEKQAHYTEHCELCCEESRKFVVLRAPAFKRPEIGSYSFDAN